MLRHSYLIFGFTLFIWVIVYTLYIVGSKLLPRNRVWFVNFKKVLLVEVFLAVPIVISAAYLFIPPPGVSYLTPVESPIEVDNNRFSIGFDRLVRADKVQPVIIPSVKGEWILQDTLLDSSLATTLSFEPQESLTPNTTYYLKIRGIEGVLGIAGQDFDYEFTTLPIPKIKDVIPANGAKDVSLDASIEVILDNPNIEGIEWFFNFDPNFKYRKVEDQRNIIKLIPEEKLEQAVTYTFVVEQVPVIYEYQSEQTIISQDRSLIYEGEFTTISPPQITLVEPQGENILPDRPIKVKFTKSMNRESVESGFKIMPETAGDISWEDDRTLVFKPKILTKGQSYQITIAQGVLGQQQGYLTEDYTFNFSVVGEVVVTEVFPAENSFNIEVDTFISLNFNQPVDKSSAQNNFNVNPKVAGRFLWKDNVMTFDPDSNLAYNTQYVVSVEQGIKAVYGLDSSQDYQFSFNTRKYQIRLSVPLIHQGHSHTCNIAATRMALAYRGVYLTEDQILSKIGYDPTPYDSSAGIWGDPNQHYVGNINGTPKGYGVHWGPISTLVNQYRKAVVYRNWNLTALLKEVEQGNPVVLWWQNGWNDPDPISWKTPDGKQINGVEGMHSEVVVGFVGNKSDPDEIIVNDPWRGVRHYNQSYFLTQWKYYQNTALVVY